MTSPDGDSKPMLANHEQTIPECSVDNTTEYDPEQMVMVRNGKPSVLDRGAQQFAKDTVITQVRRETTDDG